MHNYLMRLREAACAAANGPLDLGDYIFSRPASQWQVWQKFVPSSVSQLWPFMGGAERMVAFLTAREWISSGVGATEK